jgi:hypothetical protein
VGCSAARLPDGRVVVVGKNFSGDLDGTAQVFEPPEQHGSPSGASWRWRYLPAMTMSVGRYYGGGCVLSDGRFAVFGGWGENSEDTASCEVLTLDGDVERWDASSSPAVPI